ncbi:MAG: hypothetical protein HZB31_13315 [Nitrospirae bacterium]|nr:hypothetical protein [Nitrospirota bacterium]
MQRPVSDIKAAHQEVRAPKPRASVSVSKGSFRDQLSAIRKDDAFHTVVSPLLRSKAYHAGKNPMKFGIVQSTLKDYDPNGKIAQNVSELDESKAQQIYRMIWERAGCSRLSPELASQHFAAYVKRPRTANEALQKSGGDPGNYAAAVKAANNRRPYADGHSIKQPLSGSAEVSGSNMDLQKSRVIASLKIAENPAVREAAMESSTKNAGTEPGSSSNVAHLKPFRASEVIQNIQSDNRNGAELPIADSAMAISIEKRDFQSGMNAYERAKSGKALADGMFVKLRIPF